MFSQDLLARFWSNVDTTSDPDGHWLWTGTLSVGGYGRFWYRDTTGKAHRIQAHRFALMLIHGPMPKEIFALHKPPCVIKHCVRHIYAGTPKDNGRDAVAMSLYPSGERHHRAKLTEAEVVVIREIGHSMTQKAIAKQFHVSESTIGFVQRGILYTKVPGDCIPRRSTRPLARLTDQQVRHIRSVYTGAYGQAVTLAQQYNVSRNTIWKITSNQHYKDLL